MGLPAQPRGEGSSAGSSLALAAVMAIAGIVAFRFVGAASPYLRIAVGLWIAAWVCVALLAVVRRDDARTIALNKAASISVRERLWDRTVRCHDEVLSAYGPFEIDPLVVLEYPALSDITQAPTADFLSALGDADALRAEAFPDDEGLEAGYQQAIDRLELAWDKAHRHATRIGRDYLGDRDAADLKQATQLLRHARGTEVHQERAAYVARAQKLIRDLVARGVISIPPRVMGSIEASGRKAIG